jgi:hypothetical protein
LINVSALQEHTMTISGISPSYNTYQTGSAQNNFQQMRQDFKDLASTLQSGDLSGAQNAYAALQQIMQTAQSSNQNPSQNNSNSNNAQSQFSTDLAAIGKALQSGDLKSAQDAFAKLQQDMKAAGGGHHHHHHAQGAEGAGNAGNSLNGSSTAAVAGGSSSSANLINTTA